MTMKDAWQNYHERIQALGGLITESDQFPTGPREQAEGFRYIARLSQFAMQWFVEFGDPRHPAFFRFIDDVLKWGSPNSDNNYLRARVDEHLTYVVRGNIQGVGELLVSVQNGDMSQGQDQVLAEISLGELIVGDDGSLEIWVGGEPRDGNWIPLLEGADHLLIRQYILDWENDAPAELDGATVLLVPIASQKQGLKQM
jgi:hypothetical protein